MHHTQNSNSKRQTFYKNLKHFIWKHKNKPAPPHLPSSTSKWQETKQPKAKDNWKKTAQKGVREHKGIKQNGEHFVNLTSCKSMWIKPPWNTSNIPIGISQNFIPVESRNEIKIKITHHRVKGDGCIREGILLMNANCVSQSMFYKVLNQSVMERLIKRICLMEKLYFI